MMIPIMPRQPLILAQQLVFQLESQGCLTEQSVNSIAVLAFFFCPTRNPRRILPSIAKLINTLNISTSVKLSIPPTLATKDYDRLLSFNGAPYSHDLRSFQLHRSEVPGQTRLMNLTAVLRFLGRWHKSL